MTEVSVNGTAMRWYGAGGPAYYLEGAGGATVAILFWSDADVAGDGEDLTVMEAGWSLVMTADGRKFGLDGLKPLAGLGDEESVEAINEAVEFATKIVGEET